MTLIVVWQKGKETSVAYQVQQLDIVLMSDNKAPFQVQQLDIVLVSDNNATLIVQWG